MVIDVSWLNVCFDAVGQLVIVSSSLCRGLMCDSMLALDKAIVQRNSPRASSRTHGVCGGFEDLCVRRWRRKRGTERDVHPGHWYVVVGSRVSS